MQNPTALDIATVLSVFTLTNMTQDLPEETKQRMLKLVTEKIDPIVDDEAFVDISVEELVEHLLTVWGY